jgi:hypothetical protein
MHEESQPDGGYGWVCVDACCMFNAFTWGSASVSLINSDCKSSNYLLMKAVIWCLSLLLSSLSRIPRILPSPSSEGLTSRLQCWLHLSQLLLRVTLCVGSGHDWQLTYCFNRLPSSQHLSALRFGVYTSRNGSWSDAILV